MNIMTKRGNQDNMVTYEHICDTTDDLANISPEYVTLGSVAIVLKGDAGMETYMATSDKEWIPLALSGGAAAGGISLPEVTTADNGKVLGVVEGEWNKMAAGTNSDCNCVMVVHSTWVEQTPGQGYYVLDKTWNEIDTALRNGQIVNIIYEDPDTGDILSYLCNGSGSNTELQRYGIQTYSGGEYTCQSADDFPKDWGMK